MHPFYGPSGRLLGGGRLSGPSLRDRTPSGGGASSGGDTWVGLVSMAAYLGFWAVALVIGRRTAERYVAVLRPGHPAPDPALALLRERFARGDLTVEEFWAAKDVLDRSVDTATRDVS